MINYKNGLNIQYRQNVVVYTIGILFLNCSIFFKMYNIVATTEIPIGLQYNGEINVCVPPVVVYCST